MSVRIVCLSRCRIMFLTMMCFNILHGIHTFSSSVEADGYINKLEVDTGVRYIRQKSRTSIVTDITSLRQYGIFFKDPSGKLDTEGTPFVILDSELRECCQGPTRHKPKRKPIHNDHDVLTTSKTMSQNTKKVGCRAQIVVKTIMTFPDYKLTVPDTKYARRKQVIKLRQEYGPDSVKVLQVIVVSTGEHTGHLTGQLADFSMTTDRRVSDYISGLVSRGIRNVDEVIGRVKEFVPSIVITRETNRRFYPNRKTVYNIMYDKLNSARFVKDEQVNTNLYVEELKTKSPKDNVFFRPASDPKDDNEPSSLLFVHQTNFQREILEKYGREVALVDATYNTSRYQLPLFMVAVLTNSGFVVVASFIVGRECEYQIGEALGVLRKWNAKWAPKYFLSDYDLRQIAALESVFIGLRVYLCQFHVVQAWKRWLTSAKNINSEAKNDILQKLTEISHCKSEGEYETSVRALKESPVYESNRKLQNWLKSCWFPEHERWVNCYRNDMTLRINTTDGLERQNRLFKESFLKKFGFGGTLVSLIQVMVEKYLPAMQIRYMESNINAMRETKAYSEYVPLFLQNKPKDFVSHCLQRMSPKTQALEPQDIVFQSSEACTVKSPESGKFYQVTFVDMMPFCACLDFEKHHMPCKHLLGIILECPDYGWDLLNRKYTDQPCFNVDYTVMTEHNEQQPTCDSNGDIENEGITDSYGSEHNDTNNSNLEKNSVMSERKACLKTISDIQNSIYAINDFEVLNKAKKELQTLNSYLVAEIPRQGTLPLRKTKAAKRKLKSVQQKKKVLKKNSYVTEICDNDVIVDGKYCMNLNQEPDHEPEPERGPEREPECEIEHEPDLEPETEPEKAALCEIWRSVPSDEPIIQIGPYTLMRNSFHFLKTTLSDELIDAYLSSLTKGTSVLHISCVVATAIFEGKSGIHDLLRSVNFNMYETCIGAVNEGGIHWVLVPIFDREINCWD